MYESALLSPLLFQIHGQNIAFPLQATQNSRLFIIIGHIQKNILYARLVTLCEAEAKSSLNVYYSKSSQQPF